MRHVAIAILVLSTASACAQPSTHRKGPHGLEAWTVSHSVETLESQGPLPTELFIARDGKMLRHLKMSPDGPFFWNLTFLDDGRQLAFTHGPLHFAMTCSLIDVSDGKRIADRDCFKDQTDDAPDWVKQLLSAPEL